MFTGIVDHRGRIAEAVRESEGLRLRIETEFREFQPGESISVDGCCLTVTEFGEGFFEAQLSPETLRRTIAEQYTVGNDVNLERALRVGDRLGGHWVTGHIDGVGRLREKRTHRDFLELLFVVECPFEAAWLIPKGSIAINGVSLTVNETRSEAFAVTIIPHTAERTTLGALREDSLVSLEFDWLAKLVSQQTAHYLKDKERDSSWKP